MLDAFSCRLWARPVPAVHNYDRFRHFPSNRSAVRSLLCLACWSSRHLFHDRRQRLNMYLPDIPNPLSKGGVNTPTRGDGFLGGIRSAPCRSSSKISHRKPTSHIHSFHLLERRSSSRSARVCTRPKNERRFSRRQLIMTKKSILFTFEAPMNLSIHSSNLPPSSPMPSPPAALRP